ncbi:TPA: hypothetical protein QCR48_005722 [Bacillus cereus]|nr:hypothetical protein [Bacillus cereus]
MSKDILTTGPFLIPGETGVGFPVDRLIIILKNPTSSPLNALVKISSCSSKEQTGSLPFIFNTAESVIDTFDVNPIPPMSCTRLEIDIEDFQDHVLRVVTVGDYKIRDSSPSLGKLEISITGGNGNALPSCGSAPRHLPGLVVAEPTLFFRYKDFVALNC